MFSCCGGKPRDAADRQSLDGTASCACLEDLLKEATEDNELNPPKEAWTKLALAVSDTKDVALLDDFAICCNNRMRANMSVEVKIKTLMVITGLVKPPSDGKHQLQPRPELDAALLRACEATLEGFQHAVDATAPKGGADNPRAQQLGQKRVETLVMRSAEALQLLRLRHRLSGSDLARPEPESLLRVRTQSDPEPDPLLSASIAPERRSHSSLGQPPAAYATKPRAETAAAAAAEVGAGQIVIVASCPEQGSLRADGGAPYDQAVMTRLVSLQQTSAAAFAADPNAAVCRIRIAFDRAGTSTASKQDAATFHSAEILKTAGGPVEVWKKLIKDTKWFQTYTGGVKKSLMMAAQTDPDANMIVLCIDGGMITSVEQDEMSTILAEAKSDATKNGVMLRTSMRTMSYCDFLREYGGGEVPTTDRVLDKSQAGPAPARASIG